MKRVIMVTLMASVFVSNAHAACAKKDVVAALDVRALQSSMMVAALSCNLNKQYNRFINKYQNNIVTSSGNIRAYFQKKYGSQAEEKLNQFVTGMANKATQQSMSSEPYTYCDQMAGLFSELIGEDTRLSLVSKEQGFAKLHNVRACS